MWPDYQLWQEDHTSVGVLGSVLNVNKMQRTLLHIQKLLVSRQYEALEKLGGIGLSAEIIRQAIEEWPGKENPDHFIMPPDQNVYKLVMEGGLDPIPGVEPEVWVMEMYLWTTEQGRSDLSARLTIIDVPGELYRVRLDDILVM